MGTAVAKGQMNLRRLVRAAAISVCVAILSVGAQASSNNRNGDGERIGQAWCDAWNSHDVAQVLEVFTEDIFYEDVPFGQKVHGSEELREFAQFFFTVVPDVHLDCVTAPAKEGHGSIEWTLSGTDAGLFDPPTGKKFSVRGATIMEIEEGKISRNSDYWDLATVMRQVGLLK